jgi:hypothetical protein
MHPMYLCLVDSHHRIWQEHYTRPFTVKDICNGMVFNVDLVLPGKQSCIQSGSLSVDMVGQYIMTYYVTELRIMYNDNGINNVYPGHPPIFENICGVIPIDMHVSHQEIVCVHGNISFRTNKAIFKGVRNVHDIKVLVHLPVSTCTVLDHSMLQKSHVFDVLDHAMLQKSHVFDVLDHAMAHRRLSTRRSTWRLRRHISVLTSTWRS